MRWKIAGDLSEKSKAQRVPDQLTLQQARTPVQGPQKQAEAPTQSEKKQESGDPSEIIKGGQDDVVGISAGSSAAAGYGHPFPEWFRPKSQRALRRGDQRGFPEPGC